MESLNIILLFVAIIVSMLCIILFFKVWGMCNSVKRIERILRGESVKTPVEALIYERATNSPTFDAHLRDAVYLDLKAACYAVSDQQQEEDYNKSFMYWVDLCKRYGWIFPELLKDCTTAELFKQKFFYNK